MRSRRWRILHALLRERQRWQALTEEEMAKSSEWRAGYMEGIRTAEEIVENNGTRREE